LIATSLYATGFAEYVAVLTGNAVPLWAVKAFAISVVLCFLVVNVLGSRLVGRAEIVIVAIEMLILIGLALFGLNHARPDRLLSGGGQGGFGIVTGAAILYFTYEGFGVVTNASNRMANPSKELPRAMFAALGVVTILYVGISALVIAILPGHTIIVDAGHVLANAGQVALGRIGFLAVAAAAILATSSAVNATLFAASNVAYDEARNGEPPRVLTSTIGRNGTASRLVSAGIVIILVVFFPLNAVGQMTSLAFLVIYGAVSVGHLRVRARTGARAWPLVLAGLFNLLLFGFLFDHLIRSGDMSAWITLVGCLVGSFIVEGGYRVYSARYGSR